MYNEKEHDHIFPSCFTEKEKNSNILYKNAAFYAQHLHCVIAAHAMGPLLKQSRPTQARAMNPCKL